MEITTVRKIMAETGISENRLAARIGVSNQYLWDVLRGHRNGQKMQPRLEQALGELIVEQQQKTKSRAAAAPAPRQK